MEFSIYQGPVRIACVDGGGDPRKAWRAARALVRARAFQDGVEGPEEIYTTANRAPCVSRGIFRAVPTIANR